MDLKISALTGATAAADANEIPINEAGTTKKLTVAKIKALISTDFTTATQITSTIATGTPPFIVNSTTLNSNLNADKLDGNHGSYFAPLTSIPEKATGAELTAGTDNFKMATAKALSDAGIKAVTAINNLAKNGNFINNSTNGYGSTPDDWTNSNANPVQGGFPTMTKQQLIDLLGISDGDIEGLWNLNEASGNATDLSANGYTLTKPAYSEDVCNGGTASTDSIYGGTSNPANLAFDNDAGTRWLTANVAFPHWLKYDLGAGVTKIVTKITLDVENRRVKDFTLAGSNNDSSWVDIGTGQHGDNASKEEFTFSNTTAYRYYRLTFSNNWEASNYCAVDECEMIATTGDMSSDDGLMGKARDFENTNNGYFANTAANNIDIAGAQTWFAFIKPESFVSGMAVMGCSGASDGTNRKLVYFPGTDGAISFYFEGASGIVNSDVKMEAGKWYFIVATQASNVQTIWINGIKKTFATTGALPTGSNSFSVGRMGSYNGRYFDGLIQNAGVLSVALTDSQVKKLFAATMYRGQKIRRATTNALITQALPEDLVERLRGKDVSIVARAYQTVASTMQVSIDDGTETASATNTTVDAWQNIGISKTISATAVAITLKLKHSTTDGNTWFKEVAFYEGSTLVYVWYPSYDDISRFSKALAMDFADKNLGYRVEGNMAFFAGALTTTELTKDGQMGYDTTNNRLYIREQGVVKYVGMT